MDMDVVIELLCQFGKFISLIGIAYCVAWCYLATCIQILNKNIIKGDFLKNELPTL